MNKLAQVIFLAVVAVMVLTAVTPALAKLTHAFIPLIVTVAVCVALLRAVWFFTR
jgi:Na+-translocating ferredoxin:NAD+ oxidoreductase RnfE subunit